jgi:lysophospholipase L1-like esterase
MKARNFLFSTLLLVVSVVLMLGVGEAVLRVKNSTMSNYDIEMWRYARDLKFRSDNPLLGHDHVKNSSALLQSVLIRTNEWGLRGAPTPPRDPNVRRILFLGSSITLGWGVNEQDTETEQLRKMFEADGQKVEVLNAGIGNYNAERYVERFFSELKDLNPSDIVVQYFLRDAEKLDDGQGNFLLRHSELAVTLWIAMTRLTGKIGLKSLKEHYQSVYEPNSEGCQTMQASLRKLAEYAKAHNIRLFMAMTPDVHNLADYPFSDIHRRMESIAKEDGYRFIDLLPAFKNLPPEQIWAMPGDPHPNALGHHLMAEAMYPVLRQDAKAEPGSNK